jgi:hypothetical protein
MLMGKFHGLPMIAALLLLSSPLRAGDISDKPWRSTPDLSMGSRDVQVDGGCLRMSATVVDSSLARLHKKRVPGGAEFHRGKTTVDRFPDEVMVEVAVTDCASPYSVALGKDVLGHLQFAAAWRRGNDERAVGGIYVPHSRPQQSSAESNDTFRLYELSIQTQDVPLTDRLVLTVSSSDGKKLAQFVTDF